MLRVRLTVTVCCAPPRTSVIEVGLTLLMAMLDALEAFTVRPKAPVAEATPLPLAVMLIVWLLTSAALLAALKLMLPELPVPGWVKTAVTPLGRALVDSVTLPV